MPSRHLLDCQSGVRGRDGFWDLVEVRSVKGCRKWKVLVGACVERVEVVASSTKLVGLMVET